MRYFVTVLTDTCQIESHTYVIHTRIHQFIYRIEVFKDGQLIDTTEAKSPESTDAVFHPIYKQAHQIMRMKYCKQNQNDVSLIQKETVKLLPKPKPVHKNSIKLALIGSVAMLLLLYLYTNVFIYSKLYIDMVYTQPKEKIAYFERIENITHILAQRCLSLSKKEQIEDDIFTLKQCKTWCAKNMIQKDTCNLFFAYSARNYISHNKIIQEQNTTAESNLSLKYVVLPQVDLLLGREKNVTVQINNLSTLPLHIHVEKILLDQNTHEEIVQFREAVSKLELHANEEKKFVIFLESSYYDQFKKGKYTGYIEFMLNYQGKQSSFRKKFSFMVE